MIWFYNYMIPQSYLNRHLKTYPITVEVNKTCGKSAWYENQKEDTMIVP